MFFLLGIFRAASAVARAAARASARTRISTTRNRTRQLAARRLPGAAANEAREAAQELQEQAYLELEEAFLAAIETMQTMIVNAGQQTVFNDEVIPQFAESFNNSDPQVGWEEVNIGEYMAFMGQIVNTGNQLMEEAYALFNDAIAEANYLLVVAATIEADNLAR